MPETLNTALQDLKLRTERLAIEVLVPLAARVSSGELPRATALAEVREAAKATGLFGLTQPAEFGGQPGGPLALTLVRDTLASFNNPLSSAVLGPGPGVLAGCHPELKPTHLAPVLAGEKRAAFAITEPADAERHTWAVRDGTDLLVSGVKSYVTGGADADFINTLVELEGAGRTLVVIDRTSPGVKLIKRFESLDGSHHAVLRFDQVRVPETHLLGRPGEGMPRSMGQIGDTRLAIAAQATGLARWVLDYLNAQLSAPHRTGQPLGDREGVRLRYADLRIQAYAARSMLYRTARLAEAGNNIRNEGMACKIFATETLSRIVDDGIQLSGGQALSIDHPLAQLYQRVRSWRIAEGANDILRINLARGALEFGLGEI
jgi:acyl-CoA dehydrogenase